MLKTFLIKLISLYQKVVSPFLSIHLNLNCRYYPSCSEYARLAILEWGLIRGSLLAFKRILRCHPLSQGGIDFPPTKIKKKGDNIYG
ncbi:MAG: membrane protein insertion efficiency factor YidD [Caldimicrobium sp.]